MENLIKLHKALWRRIACHVTARPPSGAARPPHTAFWLMHGVRAAIPQTNPLAKCEFTTIRERLIKIGARVIEHIARRVNPKRVAQRVASHRSSRTDRQRAGHQIAAQKRAA
jgi:Transposase DDE domain group 1